MMNLKKFIDEETIKKRIEELAFTIKDEYSNKITILSILKGSFIFCADLIRALHKAGVEAEIYFIEAKSYEGKNSKGNVLINGDFTFIENRNILIVEDIYDTGLTLFTLYNNIINNFNPKNLEICVLFYKKKNRLKNIKIDYIGFEIEDRFIVGYGLDYNEKFRDLPYIAILE